jgi:hypothetical protein
MRALNGIAPGGALSKALTRVTASQELGGVRPIEVDQIVSGVTTTGVRDQINKNFFNFTTNTSFGSNPPPNLDGNPLGTRWLPVWPAANHIGRLAEWDRVQMVIRPIILSLLPDPLRDYRSPVIH